jgi:hypothetical protein
MSLAQALKHLKQATQAPDDTVHTEKQQQVCARLGIDTLATSGA